MMQRVSKEELVERLEAVLGEPVGMKGLNILLYGCKKNLQTISQDQAAFEAQKNLADGRKTWKAYLWQICGQEYDAQHNG